MGPWLIIAEAYHLEQGDMLLIIGIMGRFTTIFATKIYNVFDSLGLNAVDTQKWPLRGQSYPSSTICL